MTSWWAILTFLAALWGGVVLSRHDGWVWLFLLISALYFFSDLGKAVIHRNAGMLGGIATLLIVFAFIFAGWRVGIAGILGAMFATMLGNYFLYRSMTLPFQGPKRKP